MIPHDRLLPGALLCGATVASATASVLEFQEAAAAHPKIAHQYTFDGETQEERLADKAGDAPLLPRPFGSGTAEDLGFGEPGLDESSQAVMTTREEGGDFAGGAALRAESVTLGSGVSFEAVFQPGQAEIEGGNFNLGYIVTTRVGGDRGYFLVQGDAPLPSQGRALSSTVGNSFSEENQNLLVASVSPNHWYYVAGSYRVNEDTGTVTWTNYFADITAGQTLLNVLGPFTNSGGTYSTASPTPLGIGGRWDAGESFPGRIDEVNLYDSALEGADFQEHLDFLTGRAKGFQITEIEHVPGAGTTITWNSVAGRFYAVEASEDFEFWEELDDGVPGLEEFTTYFEQHIDTRTRFYRIREP